MLIFWVSGAHFESHRGSRVPSLYRDCWPYTVGPQACPTPDSVLCLHFGGMLEVMGKLSLR